MIVSKQKALSEIMVYLENDHTVFILGCNGCAQSSGTGGHDQVADMKSQLANAGKEVTGDMVVDFLCQKTLVRSRLRPRKSQLEVANSVLVMTCGIGVQAVAAVTGKVCYPAADTLYMGGAFGEWMGKERCGQCGDCLLAYTGGICPVTACSKSLTSGSCGGASEGKCELDHEKECGWELIYNRLKDINRLDNLMAVVKPRDHSKRMIYGQDIAASRWALEQSAKGVEK
jgi:hypothetical protein